MRSHFFLSSSFPAVSPPSAQLHASQQVVVVGEEAMGSSSKLAVTAMLLFALTLKAGNHETEGSCAGWQWWLAYAKEGAREKTQVLNVEKSIPLFSLVASTS
jgi:hypothetical protein